MALLESLLLALAEATAQAIAQAVIGQMQQPSTVQDGYVDAPLIKRIENEIDHPNGSD